MILKVFMLIILSSRMGSGGAGISTVEFSSMQDCLTIKEQILAINMAKKLTVECYER